MNRIAKPSLIALLWTPALSFALTKCVVNGATVFQDRPCADSGETVGQDVERRNARRDSIVDQQIKGGLQRSAMSPQDREASRIAMETEAKERVANQMKDPSSVQFRSLVSAFAVPYLKAYPGDTRGGSPINIVCGEFNAKNSWGAYTGYKPFYAIQSGRVSIPSDGQGFSELSAINIMGTCANATR